MESYSQDTTQSLAFKRNRPIKNNPYFYRPDLSYQLLQQFRLIQEANAGNSLAQHELGLRLLLGEGLPADTLKAAEWIKKAADQGLSAAAYNFGIMLINGIGVQWNPFDAFSYFQKAAIKGMPQAQYVLGILYTDNLIVPRNWDKAYYWIFQSKENGFDVEEDLLNELSKKVSITFLDSIKSGSYKDANKFSNENYSSRIDFSSGTQSDIDKSLGLSFIDFDALEDSTKYQVTDIDLIKDLTRTDIQNILDTLNLSEIKSIRDISTKEQINYLLELCNYGAPEALTLIGKLYEEGILFDQNILAAAEYYIRAIRYESFRAPFLLNDLLQKKNLRTIVEREIRNQNPTAMFVWYGLSRFGYQNSFVMNDAINFLQESASSGYISSINELALLYFTGDYLNKNEQKAVELWKLAESFGSSEATIRLVLKDVFSQTTANLDRKYISSLLNFSSKGSVLSQAALGYCYLTGITNEKNTGLAAKYFRLASYRGNNFAYEQLKNMYNQLRPKTTDFNLN